MPRFQALQNAALPFQGKLPVGMNVRHGEAVCRLKPDRAFLLAEVQKGKRFFTRLAEHEQITPEQGQLAQEKSHVHSPAQQFFHYSCRQQRILPDRGVNNLKKNILPGQAKHILHVGNAQAPLAKSEHLPQKRHSIAHAARRAAGQKVCGLIVIFNSLAGKHTAQMSFQFLG